MAITHEIDSNDILNSTFVYPNNVSEPLTLSISDIRNISSNEENQRRLIKNLFIFINSLITQSSKVKIEEIMFQKEINTLLFPSELIEMLIKEATKHGILQLTFLGNSPSREAFQKLSNHATIIVEEETSTNATAALQDANITSNSSRKRPSKSSIPEQKEGTDSNNEKDIKADKKAIKRERNRVAAQRSRHKKQKLLDEKTKKIEEQQHCIERLEAEITTLRTELQDLRRRTERPSQMSSSYHSFFHQSSPLHALPPTPDVKDELDWISRNFPQ